MTDVAERSHPALDLDSVYGSGPPPVRRSEVRRGAVDCTRAHGGSTWAGLLLLGRVNWPPGDSTWLVLHEFLPLIVGQSVLDDVVQLLFGKFGPFSC